MAGRRVGPEGWDGTRRRRRPGQVVEKQGRTGQGGDRCVRAASGLWMAVLELTNAARRGETWRSLEGRRGDKRGNRKVDQGEEGQEGVWKEKVEREWMDKVRIAATSQGRAETTKHSKNWNG